MEDARHLKGKHAKNHHHHHHHHEKSKSGDLNGVSPSPPRNWGNRLPFLAQIFVIEVSNSVEKELSLQEQRNSSSTEGTSDDILKVNSFSSVSTIGGGAGIADRTQGSLFYGNLMDLIMWRKRELTGVWFLVIQLVFILVEFANYRLSSLLAYLCIWHLMINYLLFLALRSLQESSKLNPETLVRSSGMVLKRYVMEYADLAYELTGVFNTWYKAYLDRNGLLQTFFVVWLVYIIDLDINTLTWLVMNALFIIPVNMENPDNISAWNGLKSLLNKMLEPFRITHKRLGTVNDLSSNFEKFIGFILTLLFGKPSVDIDADQSKTKRYSSWKQRKSLSRGSFTMDTSKNDE